MNASERNEKKRRNQIVDHDQLIITKMLCEKGCGKMLYTVKTALQTHNLSSLYDFLVEFDPE